MAHEKSKKVSRFPKVVCGSKSGSWLPQRPPPKISCMDFIRPGSLQVKYS